MNAVAASAVLLAAAVAVPAAVQPPGREPSLDIRDAAARVVVVPEARNDVVVQVAPGDPRLPPLQITHEGARTVIEGGLQRRIAGCSSNEFGWNGNRKRWNRSVEIRGLGKVAYEALPVITMHTPMRASVGAGGAVWGEVGPSEELHLVHAGCGDWNAGPVRGQFDLATQGSGDTHARSAGRLSSATQGSGDLMIDSVDGPVSLAIAGSGDVRIARVSGPVSSRTAGSGDVRIAAGHAPQVAVQIAGSGDFVFDGEADALSAEIAGSGDVHVARVSGAVSKSVHGSGEVTVGAR